MAYIQIKGFKLWKTPHGKEAKGLAKGGGTGRKGGGSNKVQ